MVYTGHQAYRQNAGNAILSKDRLLLKLYEGALNFLRLARRGMEDNNPKIRGENLSKVIAIMTEFDCALDMETGGEIAENLSGLYRHVIYKLLEINMKNDIKGLDDIEKIISNLKDGFEQAANLIREEKKEQMTAVTQEAPSAIPGYDTHEHKEGMSIAI